MKDNAFLQARRSLLLDHFFFGNLVMHLDEVEDPTAKKGLWVDGKSVGYNPQAIEEMGLACAAGLLAKGVLHCALQHHVRREDRDPELWQEAADLVTNPLIIESGLKLPPGARVDPKFASMSAEEAYMVLEQERQKNQPQSQPQAGDKPQQGGEQSQPGAQGPQGDDGEGQGGGQGQGDEKGPQGQPQAGSPPQTGEVRDLPGDQPGQPASPAEQSNQAEEWKVQLHQALNTAKARGNLPAGMNRMIEKALAPVVSWREELRRFFQSIASEDLSWTRPHRKYIGVDLYLPSVRSEKAGQIVIAVDTSGSIGQDTLDAFAAEINAVCEDTKPDGVTVVYCDARINSVQEFGPDEYPIELKAQGGGGTDFNPPFRWVDEQGLAPECLIYLTDMEGPFPAQEPEYPVLWASIGTAPAPFGDLIKIDLSQRK